MQQEFPARVPAPEVTEAYSQRMARRRVGGILAGRDRVAHGWGVLAVGIGLVPLVVSVVSLFSKKPVSGVWAWLLLVAAAVLILVGLVLLLAPTLRGVLVKVRLLEKNKGSPERPPLFTPQETRQIAEAADTTREMQRRYWLGIANFMQQWRPVLLPKGPKDDPPRTPPPATDSEDL